MDQLLVKGLVFRLAHGAVDVIRLSPVVPGGVEDLLLVQGGGGDDGRRRVKKAEPLAAAEGLDLPGKGLGGEGACGKNNRPLGEPGHLPFLHLDEGMGTDFAGDLVGKGPPVHRQGPSRRDGRPGGSLHGDRPQHPHLLLQQPGGRLQPHGLEGIGTDQLGKAGVGVGRGVLFRLHLPQENRHPRLRQGPGRFAAGQAGAHNGNLRGHSSPPPVFS